MSTHSLEGKNQMLFISSFRYLDRLADSLQQKLKVSEKMVASSKLMAEKRQAASEEQMELEPKLEVIRSKTKELQGQVRALVIQVVSHSHVLVSTVLKVRGSSAWKLSLHCHTIEFDPLTLNGHMFVRISFTDSEVGTCLPSIEGDSII